MRGAGSGGSGSPRGLTLQDIKHVEEIVEGEDAAAVVASVVASFEETEYAVHAYGRHR